MKKYKLSVLVEIEVEAFTDSDAYDIVQDCFGEGNSCGLNVIEFEVKEFNELG